MLFKKIFHQKEGTVQPALTEISFSFFFICLVLSIRHKNEWSFRIWLAESLSVAKTEEMFYEYISSVFATEFYFGFDKIAVNNVWEGCYGNQQVLHLFPNKYNHVL